MTETGLVLVDSQALRARYLPGRGERLTEDEFIQRGAELVELSRVCYLLLGELVAWKIAAEQAVSEDSKRELIARYARAWGLGETRLWKAYVLAVRFPGLALPEDVNPTLAYEVVSGCETETEADEVLDLVLGEGWTVSDVREVKALRALGVLQDWRRVRLVSDGNGGVLADDGVRREYCAHFIENSDVTRAGAALLRIRGRV